jgi:hypothetical protein
MAAHGGIEGMTAAQRENVGEAEDFVSAVVWGSQNTDRPDSEMGIGT